MPPADGAPIEEGVHGIPGPVIPTVYTVEIPADEAEAVAENNARSVLVNPAGRKRRLLIIEGAPGFEHSFMKRAWGRDPALEVDSVGRKGKNAAGQDTFFVQAPAERTAALTRGFPARREDLFTYDGLVIANVEGDFFTRAQLTMAADFVAERGGGLLVVGARSFAQRGCIGTPLEDVLPVELDERRGALVPAGGGALGVPKQGDRTPEGALHPRCGLVIRRKKRRLWSALPTGWRRTARRSSTRRRRAGRGVIGHRRNVSRQWRCSDTGGTFDGVRRRGLLAVEDAAGVLRSQLRILLAAGGTMDRRIRGRSVAITVPESAAPASDLSIAVEVRDAAFAPVADAASMPPDRIGGQQRSHRMRRSDRVAGQ